MATDKELLDRIVAAAHMTTVGYVNRHWKPPPPAGTKWAEFDQLAEQLGKQLDQPPIPPEPVPTGAEPTLWVCRHNPGTINQVSHFERYNLISMTTQDKAKIPEIRKANPKVEILCYRNGGFVTDYSHDRGGNSGVTFEDAKANNWILKDASGNYLRSGRYNGLYFLDLAMSGLRQKWIQNVTAWAKEDGFDGIFVDDINPNVDWHLAGQPYPPKYPNRDAWSANMGAWVANFGPAVQNAGLSVVPNIGAAWDQVGVWKPWAASCTGAVREHFMNGVPPYKGADWGIHARTMRDVLAAGRPFYALTFGSLSDIATQRYIRASFLLFHDPNYNSSQCWDASDTGAADPYTSGWTWDLGAPQADAIQSGAIWTRQFEKGKVVLDTTAGTVAIS
jgi:Hypothetical glycosyl hydrolase family 15